MWELHGCRCTVRTPHATISMPLCIFTHPPSKVRGVVVPRQRIHAVAPGVIGPELCGILHTAENTNSRR